MTFEVKGWCPGALRPMESGDGWVVRVRAPLGQLSPVQARGIAAAARAHGNGLCDLTGRANLQIRGVTPATHAALVADLTALGLIDADVGLESRRNILLSPFAGPEETALAAALEARLRDLPALPGKFGFVLDAGPVRHLADVPGDIRLERGPDGLILRADGADLGTPLAGDPVAAMIALAHWFVAQGGVAEGRGRMAGLVARGVLPPGGTASPVKVLAAPGPGLRPEGALLGFAFGQMQAETLAFLADLGPLRLTPWRMLLVEGLARLPEHPGLITDPADPLRRVVACTGAPGCPQARAETRVMAARLAADVPDGRLLHVSGCAKGCAHPAVADITLLPHDGGIGLVRRGRAGDPARTVPAESLAGIWKDDHALDL